MPDIYDHPDFRAILEIARVGLLKSFEEIAEELDLSNEEMKRLEELLHDIIIFGPSILIDQD